MKCASEGSVKSSTLHYVLGSNETVDTSLLRKLSKLATTENSPFLEIEDQENIERAREFRCDITGMDSFLGWSHRPCNEEEVRGAIFQITRVIELSIKYQLPLTNIDLDCKRVFYYKWKSCLQFAYLPVSGVCANSQRIRDFFLQVIGGIAPTDAPARKIQTMALESLRLGDYFNPQTALLALKAISGNSPTQAQNATEYCRSVSRTVSNSKNQESDNFSYFSKLKTNTGALNGRKVVDKPKSAQGASSSSSFVPLSRHSERVKSSKPSLTVDVRGTIDLSTLIEERKEVNTGADFDRGLDTDEKPTDVLNQYRPQTTAFWLIHERTGEKIKISSSHFVVGKSKYSSYQVRGTTTVSRSHAIFTCDGNSCWIEDDKSTNGTFVNAKPLAPEQKVKLHDGDSIRMSDEKFTLQEISGAR